MRKIASVAGVALCTVLVAACAQTTPKIAFKHGETRGRLGKNGLRFVIMPDATTQLVEVDVRYEVGAREDPPGKAGLAHLVEHLMFQQRPDGPQTKPLMHFLTQAALNMNAYTNWDTTHYMVTGRAEQLDSLVKIEAMQMFYGCQTISEEEFLREREVVRNEIRGGNRSAEDRIPQLTLSAIYPKGHAYEQMVGGDDAQLSTITLTDACDFMQRYYAPERATVLVAGGVAIDATVKSIEKWFGVIDRRAPAPRRKVDPVRVAREQKTFELDLERPWLTVAWALPDARTPEGEAAQFGIWGAFFDTARKAEEYECATQARPMILGGQEAPIFVIALELKDMGKLDQCLGFVWKAARSAHRGWDEGTWLQLEEAKNRRKAELISSLEPLAARTNHIGDQVQFSLDFDFSSSQLYVFHELDKIGKFELATVGAAVRRALDPDRARVSVFRPSKEGPTGAPLSSVRFQTRSHDRVEEPEVDPDEARRPLRVGAELKLLSGATRFALGNGMRVVLLPVDAMPVVAAQLIFDAGEAAAPDNPALARAAADFLMQPPGATALAESGVQMGCDATPDHTICSARGMSVYLEVVIKGLERLIKAGGYSQEGVERWQQATKATYKLRRPQQQLEFQRQQLAALFGPDHPYTKTGVVLPRDVGKIGRDALFAFRDKHYSAANATLVIAGAFDAKRAEALIRDSFGGWGKGHKDAPISQAPGTRTGPVYVGVIGEPDPQVDVAILYPSPAGLAGQQAARMVLTEMLNQRMWDVRGKLGATYGAYARRNARLGPSAYRLGGAVDAPRAGEAISAMRGGIDALRRGEDFDVSFVRARRKIVQQLLGESTMSMELAARLGQIERFALHPAYFDTLLRQVAVVSPTQVKALLAAELEPAREVLVVLGDRGSVTKAFADAGLPDAKLVEPQYE
ncbi:MAG TPA: insulinase family protein [Kofleriaceae bacterium]|nr:insulinase family protein [Kofleriaceae bacterium]